MRYLLSNNIVFYFIIALLSILLSYNGSLRAVVVNPDGICYLQSAASFGAGVHAAMQLCDQAQWPFYSALIFGFVSLSHVSYISAAFIVNGLLSLISVFAFIYIVQLLGGTRRVLWLAAAVILLAHEFNSVREYVIRDHGFWAFYLLSIAALLQYFRRYKWSDALLWIFSIIIASLFRIEGILFLVFLPFLVWLDRSKSIKERLIHFLQINSLTLILVCAVLSIMSVHHGSFFHLNRLNEIQFQFLHGFQVLVQNFQTRSHALGQYVLSNYSVHDESVVLLWLLIIWYFVSVISNLSVIYALLVCYALWKKLLKFDNAACIVLFGYLLINVLITAVFLVDYMFLSKRYLIALSLILMLCVPFALDYLMTERSHNKWLLASVVFFIFASALGGIVDFGYSKSYIRDAGLWLAKNTSANAEIYSNDPQVMFYSNHFSNDTFKKKNDTNLSALGQTKWKKYDYLAIHINRKELLTNKVINEMKLIPIKTFANKRGDEVLIYKVGENF